MTNLPATIPAHLLEAVAHLPAELQAQAIAMFKPDASRFRSIAFPRFGQFALREGGSETIWPMGQPLYVIILGKAERYHRQWYGGKVYQPGDNLPPVAQWVEGDEVPAIVPPECFSENAPQNIRVSWKRRLVVAIMYVDEATRQVRIDMDKPYVMDLSGKSCFKPGYPQQNQYSFSGYEAICGQQNRLVCDAALMLNFDPNESVPVITLTPTTQPGTNIIVPLPDETRVNIIRKGMSAEVQELLTIKRIDGTEKATAQPAAQPQYQAPAQPAYQASVAQPVYQAPVAQPVYQAAYVDMAGQTPGTQPVATVDPQQEAMIMQQQLAAQQLAAAQTAAFIAQQQAPATVPVQPVTAPIPTEVDPNAALLAAAAVAQQNATSTVAQAPVAAAAPAPAAIPTEAAVTDELADVLSAIGAL